MITDIVSFTAEGPEHDHRRKSREKSKENTEYLKTQKNEGWCMAS